MTVKERIQEDGVAMRWLRTAATTITAVAAAGTVIWGAVLYLVSPRIVEWGEQLVLDTTETLRNDLEANAAHLERLDDVVVRMEEILEGSTYNPAPSWRFDPVDTTISDGYIGGDVTITASGYKLRDCGVPTVDLYFINGGGIYHRFAGASLLSPDGRGVALPVAPERLQRVTYTATIPSDDEVSAGRARGYISIVYPDGCPAVAPAVAGPLQFRILREE
jgi:hypothetical protein